mgnify:CR=1 FL=1
MVINKDEEVMAMESKLSERQSENETLISEAYRKDRQAHNDTISLPVQHAVPLASRAAPPPSLVYTEP